MRRTHGLLTFVVLGMLVSGVAFEQLRSRLRMRK